MYVLEQQMSQTCSQNLQLQVSSATLRHKIIRPLLHSFDTVLYMYIAGQSKTVNKDLNKEVSVAVYAKLPACFAHLAYQVASAMQVSKFARDAATTFAPRASGPSKNPAFKGEEGRHVTNVQICHCPSCRQPVAIPALSSHKHGYKCGGTSALAGN